MKFKKLDKKLETKLLELIGHAFADNMETAENKYFFSHDLTWENIYGWVDGENPVSTYISLPAKIKIREKRFTARLIEYVATLPNYRQKGLVRKMMQNEMSRAYSEGIAVLLLDPFKHSYYRQFGFETAMDKNLLRVEWDLLSDKIDSPEYQVKFSNLKNSDLKEDYKKVRQWLWDYSPYNEILLPEPAEEVKFYNQDKVIAVVYNQHQQPEGYLIYAQQGRNLQIDSFRYISLEAFYGLKKLILSYRDQVNKIIWKKIPIDFPLDLLVNDYWQGGTEVELLSYSSKMMRVVNVEQFLNSLTCAQQKGEIILQVIDPLIMENNSCYAFKNGQVVKLNDSSRPDLKINVSDLSPLLTGRRTAGQLYQLGKLKLPDGGKKVVVGDLPEEVKILDRLFPGRVTFNGDE